MSKSIAFVKASLYKSKYTCAQQDTCPIRAGK